MKNKYIYKIVISALFVSLALIINQFLRLDLFILGSKVLRFGPGSIFSALPAVLFGPFFGAVSSGVVDVVGFLFRPSEGPYMPLLTVMALLGGFLRGILWLLIRKSNIRNLNRVFIIIISAVCSIGLINHIMIAFFPGNPWSAVLDLLGTKKYVLVYLVDFIGIVGLVFFLVNQIIVKKTKDQRLNQNFLKLIIALGIAGLLETSLNTLVFKYTYMWNDKVFVLSLLARVAEEIFMTIIKAYVISFIIELYYKTFKSRIEG